jgi:hypothetical protein
MDAAGDHADPGHPSRTAACPTAALQDLPSAGHSGRGNAQTPDANTGRQHRTADTGQRTPGRSDARTGHWTSAPWTGKRGHWSLAPDTGHRTPDTGHRRLAEDVDRLTKARPASGPPWPPRRATALRRPTVFLWTAPAALGSPYRLGGEAAFPARDSVSPAAAWSLRPGRAAPQRIAVLGRLRVERRANGDASSVMAMGGCPGLCGSLGRTYGSLLEGRRAIEVVELVDGAQGKKLVAT